MTLESSRMNWTALLRRILLYFVVAVICLFILYPYFVMVCTALKSREEIFNINGTVFPIQVMWSNFLDIWSRAPMARYMLNSIAIAAGSTAIAMICGIPAAYALARMRFKGQTAFLGFIIVSQMFAPVVLLIGIYKVMQVMNLTNNILGLIFINAAFNQAFTIWLLRGTFLSISAEMEQAATIDGCNRIQAMFKVLLPVAAPGIVTTLIFIFINAWNEYTVALQYGRVAVPVCRLHLRHHPRCHPVHVHREEPDQRPHRRRRQRLISGYSAIKAPRQGEPFFSRQVIFCPGRLHGRTFRKYS